MKIIVWMLSMVVCFSAVASAETVFLKNGSQITGTVVMRDDEKIQLDISGVTITYYMDEVDRIEAEKSAIPSSDKVPVKPVAKPIVAPVKSVDESALAQENRDVLEQMSKRELILEFLRVFGTRRSMEENFRQILSQLPVEQALELGQVLKVDAVLEELIPIYDKHFSKEELIVYIRFYETPEGQKLVISIPEIMKESIKESAAFLKQVIPAPPSR